MHQPFRARLLIHIEIENQWNVFLIRSPKINLLSHSLNFHCKEYHVFVKNHWFFTQCDNKSNIKLLQIVYLS